MAFTFSWPVSSRLKCRFSERPVYICRKFIVICICGAVYGFEKCKLSRYQARDDVVVALIKKTQKTEENCDYVSFFNIIMSKRI